MEDFIRWAQRVEWDDIIVANLETSRKKDKVYDAKMAFLVYYNHEIDIKEKERRLNSLMLNVANNVVRMAQDVERIPWPQSWHDGEILDTQEEWDSVVENFPKARAAIQRVPEICLERRRLAFPSFWAQKREEWRSNFEKELLAFRRRNGELDGDLHHILKVMKHTQDRIKAEGAAYTRRSEELLAQIRAAKQLSDYAVSRLPPERKFCLRGISDEVLARKAATKEKIASLRNSLREFQALKVQERKKLEEDLVWFKERHHWLMHREDELTNIMRSAARRLATMEKNTCLHHPARWPYGPLSDAAK
jgi:hypothetical protein